MKNVNGNEVQVHTKETLSQLIIHTGNIVSMKHDIMQATRIKTGFGKKSSSPSGRHIGHYKTILKDDIICMVYSILMSVPLTLNLGSL